MKTILLTLTCLTALISCTSTTPNTHPATHKSGSGIGISNEIGACFRLTMERYLANEDDPNEDIHLQ